MVELMCIRFGDSIGLVNGSFALATPSLHDEPIAERFVQLSGLRAVSDDFTVTSDGFHFPSDYADRCIFKIMPDKNAITDNRSVDDVCFGSAIRLIHEPTGHALIASSVDHRQPGMLNKIKCVYLRKEMSREEESASHWIIQSRYKLRREGDFVRVNDSIILKSVHYKDFFLTIPDYPTENVLPQDNLFHASVGTPHVGMTTDARRVSASGWIVKCFRADRAITAYPTATVIQSGKEGAQVAEAVVEKENHTVITGSYVRISHIESKGHVICRADDAKAVLSKVSPLGSIYRVQSEVRTETHGVYMRCPVTSGSSSDASDANLNDCLNVWQILPSQTDGLDIFRKVSC